MSRFAGALQAEESFREWERERKEKRFQYWSALQALRKDYLLENTGNYDMTARPTMHYWAERKYGFKMGLDGQGNYTQEYTVTDPKKFMLFQIKYWQ
jgi:hypothetical protein